MDDPRNIFVTQRQGYQQQPSTGQQPPKGQTNAPKTPTGEQATGGATQTSTQSDYATKVAEMKRLAEKYQREGEGQLVKDIVNTVIEQKARGQLTNDQLVAFAKRIAPMLNADQRERLNQLVEQLIKL
ncbi:MAG: hypothetical protein IJX23_05770 [Clostridia bacterium]|nr:hypothetical protein [Clostridia bacterium]